MWQHQRWKHQRLRIPKASASKQKLSPSAPQCDSLLPTMQHPEIASMSLYLAAPLRTRVAIHEAIAASLGADWRTIETTDVDVVRAAPSEWKAVELEGHYAALATPGKASGPGLLHVPTGIAFRVIPGGEFLMGMSDEEAEVLLGRKLEQPRGTGSLGTSFTSAHG